MPQERMRVEKNACDRWAHHAALAGEDNQPWQVKHQYWQLSPVAPCFGFVRGAVGISLLPTGFLRGCAQMFRGLQRTPQLEHCLLHPTVAADKRLTVGESG